MNKFSYWFCCKWSTIARVLNLYWSSHIGFGENDETNLKKHLAVEELVVAGDEIPPVVTVQLILFPRLGD